MKPINVSIDLEANAGYVRYRRVEGALRQLDIVRGPSGSVRAFPVGDDEEHAPAVIADVDEAGAVVGVEILGFDHEALELAEDFVHSRGLQWPYDVVRGAAIGGVA